MQKPITIVLASDSHMARAPLEYVRKAHPEADYFLYCGDSELPRQAMEGWAAVRGNNDSYGEYPEELILKIGGHQIYMTHGHMDMIWHKYDQLAAKAKRKGCDICCFGHTHVYYDGELNGVRMLNPGSMRYNRDRSPSCYMLVTLDGSDVCVQRKNLPEGLGQF